MSAENLHAREAEVDTIVTSRHAAVHGTEQLKNEPQVSRGSLMVLVVVVLIIAVAAAVVGILHRTHNNSRANEVHKYRCGSAGIHGCAHAATICA